MEQQKWQWKHTYLIVVSYDQDVVVHNIIEEEGKGNVAFARAGESLNRDNIG